MAESLVQLYPTAFVTGASAGLGRAFVDMLLQEGVRVWGTSRDTVRLTDLASRNPASFTPVVLDLARAAEAEAAFTRAARYAGGGFDLVINNAGYGVFGGFDQVEFAAWQTQLDAMLGTTLRLAQAALRGMRARGRGCLVNVASLAVEFPLPLMAGYNVAKAGLSALSESLIFETRGTGISVIDFRPGDYRTDFNTSMHAVSPAASGSAAARIWQQLERSLRAGPPPARAAADLRRALLRRRSGTVRSGSFFQARLAPFLARIAPSSWRRTVMAKYFGGN
ncbi:MAG TPA: SDR family NAD(P)-dependent oxidoreductase [Opitutus sp.]|nr:SDR family NAD(P)-dependent oxidoreductase [Opitutus sp.]